MKRSFLFQKSKFLKLTRTQQHKKCAEFLQAILQGASVLIEQYQELLSWMQLTYSSFDVKSLSDQLLQHKTKAGMSSGESGHIHVTRQDAPAACDYLPISIYLENLRSLHNIGSIMRTTEALRLGTLCFPSEIDTSKLKKSAMGAENWVLHKRVGSLSELARPLIVLETIPESTPYYDFDFPDTFTLALGNEEYGCSDALLREADTFIHIPLYGRKNSLNVAVAYAIVASDIIHKTAVEAGQKAQSFEP